MPIQIFTPKAQLVKLFAGGLAFVAFGIWLLAAQRDVFYDIVAIACIVFFGVGLVFFGARLIRRVPAIQIDGFGVTDRSSAVSLGLLRWEDVASVKIGTVEVHVHGRTVRHRMLGIYPVPTADPLRRANPVKAFLLRINNRMGFSPITIAESSLPFSLETVIEQMRRFRPSLVVESSVDPSGQQPRG